MSIFHHILVICLAQLAAGELQLKMLHVVFRHGDKVPHKEFQNYPNDPYRNHSYLPIDNGDLTNEGKMREYKIGLMLRERYNTYFGLDYWTSLIYAQSTDVTRTKMSLQLVLAGLFPPSEKQVWNPHLMWNPVNFVYVPYEMDYLLFPHYCPRYREELARVLHEEDVKALVRKYKNVMGYLTHHTGKPVADTRAVNYLYNLLKEEERQNLTLPLWTKKVYPHPMTEITILDFNLKSYTKMLKRLNGGTLLRKITDDIKLVRDKKMKPTERKASLFAGHEHNVAALARTLGIKEASLPAYGSTIILETLCDDENIYYVRVLYWTGTTERLIVQKIPGCSEICPLQDFLLLLSDVIPNDDEYYCYGKGANDAFARYSSVSSVAYAQGLATLLLYTVALQIAQRLMVN